MTGCMSDDGLGREELIALASWWSGWCTDHDQQIPELATLSGFLLDIKHQMAMDRPPDTTKGAA